MKINAEIKTKLGVNVKPTVMRGDKIVKEYPMMHNLILDSGLEALSVAPGGSFPDSLHFAEVFEYAAIGIGTTATRKISTATVSVTGTTATVDGSAESFFNSADAANSRYITFADGQSATINTFTSVYEVELVESLTVTSQIATVWNVEQTSLANRQRSSNTYRDTGNNENGSDRDGLSKEKETNKNGTGLMSTSSGDATITWTNGNFEAGDVGKYIKVDTTVKTIASVAGPTSADAESTWGTETNVSGSVSDSQRIRLWRTFQFAEESSLVTYTEAGWSWGDPASEDLFGRILFTEQGLGVNVDVAAGEYLLLYVELQIDVPANYTIIGAPPGLPITNLAVAAKSKVTYWSSAQTSSILSSGSTTLNTLGVNSALVEISDSKATAAVFAIGSRTDDILDNNPEANVSYAPGEEFQRVTIAAEPYVAGSNERYYKPYFPAGSGVAVPAWTDIRFGNSSVYEQHCYRIKFDATQAKGDANTVQLVFKKSWGRSI